MPLDFTTIATGLGGLITGLATSYAAVASSKADKIKTVQEALDRSVITHITRLDQEVTTLRVQKAELEREYNELSGRHANCEADTKEFKRQIARLRAHITRATGATSADIDADDIDAPDL